MNDNPPIGDDPSNPVVGITWDKDDEGQPRQARVLRLNLTTEPAAISVNAGHGKTTILSEIVAKCLCSGRMVTVVDGKRHDCRDHLVYIGGDPGDGVPPAWECFGCNHIYDLRDFQPGAPCGDQVPWDLA